MTFQVFGHPLRANGVTLHTQMQRLQPEKCQPAVKRTRNGTDGLLYEFHFIIDVLAIGDDSAADNLIVTAEILRRAVHNDIYPIL